MKPSEAMHVLAVAAAYDNRPTSQATATTWAFDLADVNQAEAIDAVREHYRYHPDTWIKPGHVIAIVKRHRSTGISQSSRLEAIELAKLDPDAPDYADQCIRALQRARQLAAEGGANIPARVGLPQRNETDEERADRAHRGAELARAELERHAKESEPEIEEGVSESLQRAREIARQYKRDRDTAPTNPPRPLAGPVAAVRRDLESKAALSTRTERP